MCSKLIKCLMRRCGCLSQRVFFRRFLNLQKKSLEEQASFSKGCFKNLESIASEIRNGTAQQAAAIKNQTTFIRDMIEKQKRSEMISAKYIMEVGDYEEIKPSCHSFWLPIVVVIILAILLLFSPIKCTAQSTCNCCCKEMQRNDTSIIVQFSINYDSLFKMICLDTTTLKREIELSPNHIVVKSKENTEWSLMIYRIVVAIIVLLALMLMLKYLVKYWTRIAELNDKQKERLIKLAEERMEFERLRERTNINIDEKKARADIEEKARDAESIRNIEKMKQEYQTHLADVALEMVKSMNQTKEKDNSTIVNQLLQILKK